MKRRQLLRYGRLALLGAAFGGATCGKYIAAAQEEPTLSIQWLGHTCFAFFGDGKRLLVNPFRSIGCTAGYRPPNLTVDYVLISSRLLDEGAFEVLPGNPQVLFQSGVYQLPDLEIQGIQTDHDRQGGRRFGKNVAWRWQQAGITVLHMGGAAAPITVEDQILMGRPDILFVPVGGGPKAYSPADAKQAIAALNPKIVVPTHYRTEAADEAACDIAPLDEFLTLMEGAATVQRLKSNLMVLTQDDIPKDDGATNQAGGASAALPVIKVMQYNFTEPPQG